MNTPLIDEYSSNEHEAESHERGTISYGFIKDSIGVGPMQADWQECDSCNVQRERGMMLILAGLWAMILSCWSVHGRLMNNKVIRLGTWPSTEPLAAPCCTENTVSCRITFLYMHDPPARWSAFCTNVSCRSLSERVMPIPVPCAM